MPQSYQGVEQAARRVTLAKGAGVWRMIMTAREEKLNAITDFIRLHVGWKNAVPMKRLVAAVGLTPSTLKADRTNKHAGYIPELRKRGIAILSCNGGYYSPRPESDPEGRDEDFKKHYSRVRGQGMGNLYAAAEAKRAPKYKGELKLKFNE